MTMVQPESMPRRSLGNQVHSIKHVVDAEGALSGGVTSFTRIGDAVVTRSGTFNPTEIEVGEIVNGFYISVFVIGSTGAPLNGSINWYIIKTRAAQTVAEIPVPSSVGTSDIRNQIFHQEKGLAGSGDGTPMAFKGVIVVPKGMRRTRAGDRYEIVLQSIDGTNDAQFCIQAIYKTFS